MKKHPLWRFLCSLKFAVIIMTIITLALVVATFLESLYDTPTAQYWVYQARWFYAVLGIFGLLIFCVAMDRYPWNWGHLPFLLAHLGILTLLVGSYLTWLRGLDGSMRLVENDSSAAVELNDHQLTLMEGERIQVIPIQWIPPHVNFSPIAVPQYGLTIEKWISHASPEYSFEREEQVKNGASFAAVEFEIKGGLMRIQQKMWLWRGDPSWVSREAGPATFSLDQKPPPAGRPHVRFFEQGGRKKFVATSSQGAVVTGDVRIGEEIDPKWKGGVRLKVLQWFSHARAVVSYQPSEIQYGPKAPDAAILLSAGPTSKMWLGMGDRAMLSVSSGAEVALSFNRRRVILPFQLQLDRFEMQHYDGTRDPSSYQSKVTVEGAQHLISMNEPLEHKGFTFYQASYEEGSPRPTVSILSVNQDPGRPAKYWGSLLIVIGSILLFAKKSWQKKRKAVA